MKVVGAVLAGFLLGVLVMTLVHPSQLINAQQANANAQLRVHVSEMSKGGEATPKGSHVVGFSCIDAYGRSPQNFRCFVATAD
jgi:hypothetical protein